MPWLSYDYEGAGNALSLCQLINVSPPINSLCGLPAAFALNLNKLPINPSVCNSERMLPLDLTGMDAQHFLDKGCDTAIGGIEPYESGGPAAQHYDQRDNLKDHWGWQTVTWNANQTRCWRCKFKKTTITVRFTEEGVHISPTTFYTKEMGVCVKGVAPSVIEDAHSFYNDAQQQMNSYDEAVTAPHTAYRSRVSVNGNPVTDWTKEGGRSRDIDDYPEGDWQSGSLFTNTKPIQDDLMGSKNRSKFGDMLSMFCDQNFNGEVTIEIVATQNLGTTSCSDPSCKNNPPEVDEMGGMVGLGHFDRPSEKEINEELALLAGLDLDQLQEEIARLKGEVQAAKAAGRELETVINALTVQNYPAVAAVLLTKFADSAEQGGYEGLSASLNITSNLIGWFTDGVSTPLSSAIRNIEDIANFIGDILQHMNGCNLESFMNVMTKPFPRDKVCQAVQAARALNSTQLNSSVKNFNSDHLDNKRDEIKEDVLGDDRGAIIDKFIDSLRK